MHPDNPYAKGYQFEALEQIVPELKAYRHVTPSGKFSLNFAHPEVVFLLNKALLKRDYDITHWDLPQGYLCPAVPGRLDYLLYLNDFMNKKETIQVFDLGFGSSCIYGILAERHFGWNVTGSDIDEITYDNALNIVHKNGLFLNLRLQPNRTSYFKQVIKQDDYFDISICNPPFFESMEQAFTKGSRKWKLVGKDRYNTKTLNFGGKKNELTAPEGEKGFIIGMMSESVQFKNQVGLFTTLISNQSTVEVAKNTLEQIGASEVHLIEMNQGQKKSRFIAWKF